MMMANMTLQKKKKATYVDELSSSSVVSLTVSQGKRYLDYDLEALFASIQTQDCDQIFVAFQDSEGFDSSLLSDLIILLR